MPEPENKDLNNKESESEDWYNTLIIALVILIVFSLAGLWAMEWGKRRKAEKNLKDQIRAMTELNSEKDLFKKFGAAISKNPVSFKTEPIDRNILEKRQIEWNGSNRQILVIPPAMAEIMGFKQGDIFFVDSPEKSPTSHPAPDNGEKDTPANGE